MKHSKAFTLHSSIYLSDNTVQGIPTPIQCQDNEGGHDQPARTTLSDIDHRMGVPSG